MIGRAGLDFVAVKENGTWAPYALEVNLRCTGTTHTFWALQALTDGVYDPLAGEYRTRVGELHLPTMPLSTSPLTLSSPPVRAPKPA